MRSLLLAAAVAFSFSAPALAVSAVTTPGALGATDFIDWGQLGPSYTTVFSPAAVTSDLGAPASVIAGSMFQRRDQGEGWWGNFTNGDKLIWAPYDPFITIVFASPVAGAGTQWQRNTYGEFRARLAAYDDSDMLLGTVTRNGLSTFDPSGSAIFLGVLSSSVNIKKIVLSVESLYANGDWGDFAINRLLLTSTPGSGVVIPEPATWAMLIAGFGLVGLVARRRRAALA